MCLVLDLGTPTQVIRFRRLASTMHQLPTELRGQICSILRNDNEIHTLRNIALTCRAFEEPALDSLWSILPTGLSPLFRCVTNHCVAKVTTEKGAMLEELVLVFFFTLYVVG